MIIILCIHQNFDTENIYFQKNKIFILEDRCYKPEVFARASLLITDYSSIFFDFGYLQKPIIYFILGYLIIKII